ncbi:MAG: retroviral-like aspartic protease [Desulfobacteraceae bacterium]|nr:retroviral-like aspartic protease [Desulfobacteraceae bacterium]
MRFEYTAPPPGALFGKPLATITLSRDGHEITVSALVDSGATISVLPYDMGCQLGLVWEEQNIPIRLGGPLQGVPAVAVLVTGHMTGLAETPLVMAWIAETERTIPPILGQVNFFQQFKVTFEGYANVFDISPK